MNFRMKQNTNELTYTSYQTVKLPEACFQAINCNTTCTDYSVTH